MATPVAYRSSYARGGIGAAPGAYATATPDPSHICNLQHQILNPVSKAKDQIHILSETIPGP